MAFCAYLQDLFICLSVCLSVCLPAHISMQHGSFMQHSHYAEVLLKAGLYLAALNTCFEAFAADFGCVQYSSAGITSSLLLQLAALMDVPRLQGLCCLTTRAQAAGQTDTQTYTAALEGVTTSSCCLLCIFTCHYSILFQISSQFSCILDH